MSSTYKQLSDFAWANRRLVWQRQATFAAGTIYVVFNVNAFLAMMCFSLCMLAEYYELQISKKALAIDPEDTKAIASTITQLTNSGIFGAGAIVLYIGAVAVFEGPSIHMGPLFFLLMASLYTAMNACQLPHVMIARLTVFSIGFLFIPLYDVIAVWPNQNANIYSQLGVIVFVMYFATECARKFSSNYKSVQLKLAELTLERDKIAEAYRVQSQWVSTASHELRTPLTSVKASLDLIADGRVCETVEKAQEIARLGKQNGDRLADLIDDLLDFQKLESGGFEMQTCELDLRDLAREAVEVNQMLGKNKLIEFRTNFPSEPVTVIGDKSRLMQVLANILSNAVKFSDYSGVVEVTVEQLEKAGQVAICDQGVGIPEGAYDLVFAPFAQVDISDSRSFGGTGLGMSISKRIMDYLGGSINFESQKGTGTRFHIELALAEQSTTFAQHP